MGLKTNSPIFRLGILKNEWKSKYIEKYSNDSAQFISQDLEIQKYINRFFSLNGLLLHSYKSQYTSKTLHFYFSYYATSKLIKYIKNINKFQKIKVKLKKIKDKRTKTVITKLSQNRLRLLKNSSLFISLLLKKNIQIFIKKNESNLKKRIFIVKKSKFCYKKKRVRIFKKYKKLLNKQKAMNKIAFKFNNFSEHLLESLSIFTKKKYNINVILQNLNKGLSLRLKNAEAQILREVIIKFRHVKHNKFFNDTVNILLIAINKKNSSKLLSDFISSQLGPLKQRSSFLKFIKQILIAFKNSNLFYVKGIKIVIKGRINGRPRKKIRKIIIGDVPLQTLKSKISYAQSIAFTKNGTFGIRVWICN